MNNSDHDAPAEAATTPKTLSEWSRYTPHMVRLVRAALRDRRVPFWRKASLGALVLYLAMPFDLIPDFIPVVGQADDLVLAWWVLNGFVRAVPPEVLEELWTGDVPLSQLLASIKEIISGLAPWHRRQSPENS
ncbi:MAG TPA: DUF1232 domain-containing protein [Abditibacteriaceae bacterium]|jgi:uncharacterized membrane protein YkvA (DUF1232 family)